MAKVEADIDVQRFAYVGDDQGRRLRFPRAHAHKVEGGAGQTTYGAGDCAFEGLEGRLGTLLWTAEAASAGTAWFRDDAGRFDVAIDRAEFPHGLMIKSPPTERENPKVCPGGEESESDDGPPPFLWI